MARRLADEHGRAVRVVLSREDVVRLGPKRPPVAAGRARRRHGVVRVARTPGATGLDRWVEARAARWRPGSTVEEVDVPGPPGVGRPARRGLGRGRRAPRRARRPCAPAPAARATRHGDVAGRGAGPRPRSTTTATVSVAVAAGEVLDEVVLRSYAIGAVHQALGWVRSEGIAVDEDGDVLDLTIRSFGILPARAMPAVAS